MIRILLMLTALFLPTTLLAGKAMVIVLEAPLLDAPTLQGKVLQTVRKGDIIYLENSQLRGNPDQLEGFWETLDRNANTVYIPKEYVKIITMDEREYETSVYRWSHDPTDYRLEEPLPDHYPLYVGEQRRMIVTFNMGSHSKANYLYQRDFAGEEFISRKSFQLGYLQNIPLDTTDRFYFGFFLQGSSEQAQFSFDDDTRARESRGQLGGGPYMSYDIYRSLDYLFTVGGGFLLNVNRHLVTFATRDGDFEERLFNGLSVSSRIQGVFQFRDVFPKINLLIGSELELTTAQTLSPSQAPGLEGVWNLENDEISIPFGAQYAFFLGIATTY